jgi:hypothetical protein
VAMELAAATKGDSALPGVLGWFPAWSKLRSCPTSLRFEILKMRFP